MALAKHATVTNGFNVTKVIYSDAHGQRLGKFEQTDKNHWTEYAEQINQQFYFVEQNRDEWSVYLYDSSRNMHIQLDLHRKKVLFQQGKQPRTDLYDIKRVKGAADNYGDSVNNYLHEKFRYQLADGSITVLKNKYDKVWIEKSKQSGTQFKFTEHYRNEYEIHLYDAERNVNAYIDLKNYRVYYKNGNSYDWEYSYALQSPRGHDHSAYPAPGPYINGYKVTRVVIAKGNKQIGEFTRSGKKQWTQYTHKSAKIYHYTELKRDKYNVYLQEYGNSQIQLDLLNNKVWAIKHNGKKIHRYKILRISY